MALYRFLFAPVLLAVAVASGAGGGAHASPRSTQRAERPAALVAPAHGAAPTSLPPGTGRAPTPHRAGAR